VPLLSSQSAWADGEHFYLRGCKILIRLVFCHLCVADATTVGLCNSSIRAHRSRQHSSRGHVHLQVAELLDRTVKTTKNIDSEVGLFSLFSGGRGSNPRPTDYESVLSEFLPFAGVDGNCWLA
jgi:hypothetical protein